MQRKIVEEKKNPKNFVNLFTFWISCKLVSFFDDKIRVVFVLFGSIVVSAKINEFPMILGAMASVGLHKKKRDKLNILQSVLVSVFE